MLTLVGMWLYEIITFPGLVNDGTRVKYHHWKDINEKTLEYAGYFWLALTLLNTVVSLFAICKIFNTARQLAHSNVMTSVNQWAMILHAALLICQCLIVAFNAFIDRNHQKILDNIIMVGIDLLVQLAILFICCSIASKSEKLKKFNCFIIQRLDGTHEIRLVPKD